MNTAGVAAPLKAGLDFQELHPPAPSTHPFPELTASSEDLMGGKPAKIKRVQSESCALISHEFGVAWLEKNGTPSQYELGAAREMLLFPAVFVQHHPAASAPRGRDQNHE